MLQALEAHFHLPHTFLALIPVTLDNITNLPTVSKSEPEEQMCPLPSGQQGRK